VYTSQGGLRKDSAKKFTSMPGMGSSENIMMKSSLINLANSSIQEGDEEDMIKAV
jgi:hypothetical protein